MDLIIIGEELIKPCLKVALTIGGGQVNKTSALNAYAGTVRSSCKKQHVKIDILVSPVKVKLNRC